MSRSPHKIEQYRIANLQAAEIIVADPVNYPPDSLPAIWAAMILNSSTERKAPATRRAA